MSHFKLINIPGDITRNFLIFQEKSIILVSCNILLRFFESKSMYSYTHTANTSNIEIRAQTKAEKYRESLRPVMGLGKKISTCPRLR